MLYMLYFLWLVVGEMEERVAWLEAMEEVGAGAKYRDLIATQLALRLRDLELLDQERARKLARAMRQHLPPQNTKDMKDEEEAKTQRM